MRPDTDVVPFLVSASTEHEALQKIADAVRTGSLFVPIVLLYGVVCACNAGAWWLSMADEPSHPPFWRTYAITVAGFSLNFMTPMVNVGGEPFKIAAVAPWLGLRRAAGSVVIYQMLHTLGMLLSFLTAVVLGALLLPPHPAILASLTAVRRLTRPRRSSSNSRSSPSLASGTSSFARDRVRSPPPIP